MNYLDLGSWTLWQCLESVLSHGLGLKANQNTAGHSQGIFATVVLMYSSGMWLLEAVGFVTAETDDSLPPPVVWGIHSSTMKAGQWY